MIDRNKAEVLTHARILKVLEQIEDAAYRKTVMHVTVAYTDDLQDASGIVVAFVTGPDAIMSEMKDEMDKLVHTVLKRHHYVAGGQQ